MSRIIVYFAPGTCARVSMMSLEEAGVDFESRLVAFRANEHKHNEYLRLNPAGKVPALVIDERTLSENVAILYYLAKRFPEANLLPLVDDPFATAEILSDLAFCASVLHPIVTRLRIPTKFCTISDTDLNVWQLAATEMKLHFERIEKRLSQGGPWWYGDNWSSLDAYINWVWFRCTGAGFPSTPYPAFADHAARMDARPSKQRTLTREEEGQSALRKRGLVLEFNPVGEPEAAR